MSGTRRSPSKSYGRTALASSPWIVVSIGVAVMVVLLVVALGAYRGRSPGFDAQPGPPPTVALPELPLPPTGSATPTPRASRTPVARTSSPSTPDRPTPSRGSRSPSPTSSGDGAPLAAPPPGSSPVSGRYRVVESFHGGFVGEVLIRNTSSTRRDWRARLVFPGGRLVSAWLEGAPQGTADRFEDGFTYRSGEDLAGGASVALRFYVEDADSRPASCTVEGVACTGL